MSEDTITVTATEPKGEVHEIKSGLVSIILPVYMNSYTLFHYTGNCIGSIREHTLKDSYELIVVDNGSPIQPPNMDSYYADKVIKNEENLGVTKAWNQGIRTAVGEYIVLINNDVLVFDNWLEDMKKALVEDGYDLVMAHPMYSLTEPFARAMESDAKRKAVLDKGELYSDFRDFSCVMMKRSLLDEIGLFDETFFNYCSDLDFFKRMDEAGKKYTCCENVPTSHISDATGFSMKETPKIMDDDKETLKTKWEGAVVTEQKNELAPEPHPDPSPSVPELKAEVPVEYTLENIPTIIRTKMMGDKAFLVRDGRSHWITNPDTLVALGYGFGDIVGIPQELYAQLASGEPINIHNVDNFKKA